MSESLFSKHKMLIIPMRKSSVLNADEEVKSLVDHFYKGNQVGTMTEFQHLRQTIVTIAENALETNGMADKTSLDILYKYYDQLCSLEMKSSPAAFSNLKDEKMCALFNIGAFCSSLANAQDISTACGFQFAIQLLEESAGIFAGLMSCIPSAGDVVVLQALIAIALAQAQELFVLKEIEEFTKSSYIAKISYSCKGLFEQAKHFVQNSILSSQDTDLVKKLAGLEAEYHATAEYHQSAVCRGTTEEIVRLHQAAELFEKADMLLNKSKLYTKFGSEVYIRLADLNSPQFELDVSVFDEPSKKQVVKVVPFQRTLSPDFCDMFDATKPNCTKPAGTNDYDLYIDEVIDIELKKIHDADELLAEQSIFDVPNEHFKIEIFKQNEFPETILKKALYIQNEGGVGNLQKQMNETTVILNKTKEIWINCDYLLNEENKNDTKLREQFKEKWTLTPFESLCESLRTNAAKFREFIQKAKQADNIVYKTFKKHESAIKYLSSEKNIVEAACLARVDGKLRHLTEIEKMRNCYRLLHENSVKRKIIVSQMEAIRHDLKTKFMHGHGSSDCIVEATKNKLKPLLIQMENNIKYQQINFAAIKCLKNKLIHRFMEEWNLDNDDKKQSLNDCTATKNLCNDIVLMNCLNEAYDIYLVLEKDMKSAAAFLNHLAQLLASFQTQVSELCAARKADKEALLRKLEA